jgi:hypothetical protein
MAPSIVSKKPKVGALVGVPLRNGEMGAMIYLSSSRLGDAYGLLRGAWSEQQMRASDWNSPVFPSPIFTESKSLHDAKWPALGSRPDLIGRFYAPELLYHPDDASLDVSHGKFGLAESPDGRVRKLSAKEALDRFVLVRGQHCYGMGPEDIVALLEEHCLGKARAVTVELTRTTVASSEVKVRSKPKSLAELKREQFFSAWKGFVPVAAIRKAEAAVQEAIESLEGKSPAQAVRRLTTLVRTFNKLDFNKGTIERETIMDAVEVLASACGVDAEVFEEEIDAERDF